MNLLRQAYFRTFLYVHTPTMYSLNCIVKKTIKMKKKVFDNANNACTFLSKKDRLGFKAFI